METGMGVASALELSQFIVKEHVGLLRITDTYDIFDPATQGRVALARETPPLWARILRLGISKQMLPTEIVVTEGDENGPVLFRVKYPFSLFGAKVTVHDGAGAPVGAFKGKVLGVAMGIFTGLQVLDVQDRKVAEIKGDWAGWDFRFLGPDGQELGTIRKQWAGMAKEFFTSADTYGVTLHDAVRGNRTATMLLLAAALAIDMIYKESDA